MEVICAQDPRSKGGKSTKAVCTQMSIWHPTVSPHLPASQSLLYSQEGTTAFSWPIFPFASFFPKHSGEAQECQERMTLPRASTVPGDPAPGSASRASGIIAFPLLIFGSSASLWEQAAKAWSFRLPGSWDDPENRGEGIGRGVRKSATHWGRDEAVLLVSGLGQS